MPASKLQPAGETLQFLQGVWELVHALDVRSKRMAQTMGVTGPQRLVIRIVGQKPSQTASEIAQMLGKHPSTLTGVLARLEERGLLAREVDAEDRRRARFTLTAAGKKIDRERRGTVEAATRRALSRLEPTAVEAFASGLTILVEELERDD
ncbi:MAG: MarR family transcriptional regulator [Deltaproteobacteria bacterium]|nr:MarR family transcriptional regulator [Deltaproteobacteria bacterium]